MADRHAASSEVELDVNQPPWGPDADDEGQMATLVASIQHSRDQTEEREQSALKVTWFLAAAATHIGSGLIPVVLRYIQQESEVGPVSLLGASLALPSLLLFPVLAHAGHAPKAMFRLPWFWGYGFVMLARIGTLEVAARFTPAYVIQVVELTTPFVVALIGWWRLRRWRKRGADVDTHATPLQRSTLFAMVATACGGLLVVLPMLTAGNLTGGAVRGVPFAAVSVLLQALRVDLVRSIPLRGDQLILSAALSSLPLFPISAAIREPWGAWGTMPASCLSAVLFYSLGLLLLNQLVATAAIKRISPVNASSVSALRLVSTLLFGWWLLGEAPRDGVQLVGVGVVGLTVTLYVVAQRAGPAWRANIDVAKFC